MKVLLKKLSALAAVFTAGCATTDYSITAEPVPSCVFKPDEKGVVVRSYMMQTCDKTEKYHLVEIDVNGDKKPDYIGTTDALKPIEEAHTIKNYPVGKKVSMQKAADFFQWFERANSRCE